MNQPQLEQLEKRAYRSLVDDGLADVILGLFVISLGFVMMSDLDYLPLVVVVLAYPAWRAMRQGIVEPRTGYVRPSALRQAKIKNGRLTSVLVFVVLAVSIDRIVDLESAWVEPLRGMPTVLAGVALAGAVAVAGHTLDIKRWFVYSALAVLVPLLGHALGAPKGYSFFPTGGAIIGIGVYTLLAFLRQLPAAPDSERADVS